jgi:hypothetical protein
MPTIKRGLNAKEAVEIAIAYAEELLPDAADLRLEEVDKSGSMWSITLSFLRGVSKGLSALGYMGKPREYKIFTVSDQLRQVTAMKIRNAND